MRTKYTLLSEDINDKVLKIYSDYTFLLGHENEAGITTYSGVYNEYEALLKETIRRYIIQSNDPKDDDNSYVTQNLDKIAYTITNLGQV